MKRLGLAFALVVALSCAASAQIGGLMFPGPGPRIASASLACSYTPVTTGTQGTAYTGATPSASGGTPAYTFSETGTLPGGLSISSSTGVISGTPTANGSFPTIQVKVTDSTSTVANCGSAFTLVISAPAYVGPLDVAGYTTAYGYWGLRCSKSSYTGNVAAVWDAATGTTTETLLTCSAGGTINQTINPLSTTCAVACVVMTLYDQVASQNMTAVNSAAAPIFTQSGAGFGTKPVMQCSSRQMTTAGNATTLAQPFTISQVALAATFSSNGDSFSNGNAVQIQTSAANTWLYYAGTVANFTLNDNLWGSAQLVFNGSSSSSNVSNSTNNPSGTPTTGQNVNTSGIGNAAQLGLCDRTSGGLSFTGYIEELLVISSAVSSTNQQAQIANQRAYGGGF